MRASCIHPSSRGCDGSGPPPAWEGSVSHGSDDGSLPGAGWGTTAPTAARPRGCRSSSCECLLYRSPYPFVGYGEGSGKSEAPACQGTPVRAPVRLIVLLKCRPPERPHEPSTVPHSGRRHRHAPNPPAPHPRPLPSRGRGAEGAPAQFPSPLCGEGKAGGRRTVDVPRPEPVEGRCSKRCRWP